MLRLFKRKNVKGLPLFSTRVAAGFPSPADDHIERALDLNELCIQHPAATFYVRASGLSMINAGIFPEDILVVDKSLDAQHGKIVIAVIDGEFTVKRLVKRADGPWLTPENPDFSGIKLGEQDLIWGVVTTVIHRV